MGQTSRAKSFLWGTACTNCGRNIHLLTIVSFILAALGAVIDANLCFYSVACFPLAVSLCKPLFRMSVFV